MLDLPSPRIHTVTEITRSIKGLLETEFPFVTVAGEISNLRQPYSGHIYFTLKDENAQIRAVMFKTQQRYLAKPPGDGRQVICRGRISVYEPRGDYQLIVDFMEFKGVGALQAAFEQLKLRLSSEGLFAKENKKSLPLLPARIALVTSPSGAAVHDFITTAKSRFPAIPIEIFPVRVQGEEAAAEIIEAIELLNRRRSSEIIVLCRGGGSLEDLWPFNEEKLARAIHASEIPVVSAVGHEIDFTIADFTADLRAPTPTAAAEMIIPERNALQDAVYRLRERLTKKTINIINNGRQKLEIQKRMLGDPRGLLPHFMLRLDHLLSTMLYSFSARLNREKTNLEQIKHRLHKQNPAQQLAYRKKWLIELKRQLRSMIKMRLDEQRRNLLKAVSLLEAVGPHAVLGRGYAVVRSRDKKELIRSSKQTHPGQNLEVLLKQGKIGCEVTDILDHD